MALNNLNLKILLVCLTIGLLSLGCERNGRHKPVTPPPPVSGEGQGGTGVSYQEVQPFFQQYCAACHPGSAQGPAKGADNWTSPRDAKEFSDLIAQRVGNGSMPQQGSPQAQMISQAERDQIVAWAQSVGQQPEPAPQAKKEPKTEPQKQAEAPKPPASPWPQLTQCMNCHGQDGISTGPTFPNLAGQSKEYLERQLKNFRSGKRQNPIMMGMAANLKDYEIEFLAEYYSRQDLSFKPTTITNKELFVKGKHLASSQGLACVSCHQVSGKPLQNFPVPNLAGQKKQYIIEQLNAFKSGQRPTDGLGQIMENVVLYSSKKAQQTGQPAPLTDEQIEALATYFSQVQGQKQR